MGDITPLGLNLVIDDAYSFVMSVIFFRNFHIDFVELIAGQRSALFRQLVDAKLKFGKLRLAEYRAFDSLQGTFRATKASPCRSEWSLTYDQSTALR